MTRRCDLPDCQSKHYAKGFCKVHYERTTRRPGGPQALRDHAAARLALPERMDYWTDRTGVCWLWKGTVDNHGYGRVTVSGSSRLAHRVAYELALGPIPEGLTIDHLCRTPLCVRPDHMEPVTSAENARRARL